MVLLSLSLRCFWGLVTTLVTRPLNSSDHAYTHGDQMISLFTAAVVDGGVTLVVYV